jgi:hypothetical protein
MSRDYITGEEKIPAGPDATIVPLLKTEMYFDYDDKGYAYLTRAGDTPGEEDPLGSVPLGRALSILYAPTFSDDVSVLTSGAALTVELNPAGYGANRANALVAKILHPACADVAHMPIAGFSATAEFEQHYLVGTAGVEAYTCLRLVDRNMFAGVSSPVRSFMQVRDYSTVGMPNLINFWNYSKAESDILVLAHVGVAANTDGGIVGGNWPYNVAVRCIYGAACTPMWLMGTVNPPTGLQDWHWAGSADGNHLFWDASGDQLSQIQAAGTPRAVVATTQIGIEQQYRGIFSGPPQQGTLIGIKSELFCTGNNGMLAYDIYGILNIRGTADVVTGFYAAGAFEVHNDTAGNQCTYACIDLRVDDSCTVGGPHPARAYIRCRDKGNNPMLNLFTFYNEDVASAHNSGRMIVETSAIPAVNDTGYKLIRCWVDAAGGGVGTTIWLVATTTAPAA